MTKISSDLDVVERRLAESFAGAHDDPRWTGVPWTDPLVRVGRARRAWNRRVAAVSALATAGLVAGAIAGIAALRPSGDQIRVIGPAAHGSTGTGLDWLLTRDQFNAYAVAHSSPSPSTVRVPSPAPVDDELRTLQADIGAALPANTETVREDAADGGDARHATIWLHLADGTPVAVERQKLGYPLEDLGYDGSSPEPTATMSTDSDRPPMAEVYSDPQTWPSGSAYLVVTGNVMGYGLPADLARNLPRSDWSGPFVWTVTADGWFTMWTAPVSSDRLLGWAQAADAHFVAAE